MNTLIDYSSYPVKPVLGILLEDKTTKQNIVFATDSYSSMGDRYTADKHMDVNVLLNLDNWRIQPRVLKDRKEQADRTKTKAEVMTPSWLVNKMNNHCDMDYFGYKNVFNEEKEQTWVTNKRPIKFPQNKTWQDYVDSMRLEITCGEAPYLVSRYDTTTGDIIPVEDRIGILDRKLRVVNENTDTKEEWLKWVMRAYESTYGFEYQGDNLLIGRINLLITFFDYMLSKWNERPSDAELKKIANIIAWNIWQMDGLNGCVPYAYRDVSVQRQISFFDYISGDLDPTVESEPLPANIYNWRSKKIIEYNSLKEK